MKLHSIRAFNWLMLPLLGLVAADMAATSSAEEHPANAGSVMADQGASARKPLSQPASSQRGSTTNEFASGEFRGAWWRSPYSGDPSFDSFERMPGNPIHRSSPPLEWAVNGVLFIDPVSGNWFSYVGLYPKGYFRSGDESRRRCIIYRSKDHGKTWDYVGPVFETQEFRFNGIDQPAVNAPDATIVYHDGRYHLAFDWSTDPGPNKESGVGYAWSERPEGPFHRSADPLIVNRNVAREPVERVYTRAYGTKLIRRKDDWLILVTLDGWSRNHNAWLLATATASEPQGPYSKLRAVIHVEGDQYQPPIVEAVAAFEADGFIYAPGESCAANRNYQTVNRVAIERATDPAAWELYQDGSVWHSDPVENETMGTWGQNYSGAVYDGRLYALFPSRDSKGFGTINLASRPWDKPYRDRGFVFSGHTAASITFIDRDYDQFDLRASLRLEGECTLFWHYAGPIGCDVPQADCKLHPLTLTRYRGVHLENGKWSIISVDAAGKLETAAEGAYNSLADVQVGRHGNTVAIAIGDKQWAGPVDGDAPSRIGLIVGKHSHLSCDKFQVTGAPHAQSIPVLCTDALSGAGQSLGKDATPTDDRWHLSRDDRFRYGVGAIHNATGGRVKWNFHGDGFALWSPTGPDYDDVEVVVDAQVVKTVSLHADNVRASAPVFEMKLPPGPHAVVLHGSKKVPLVVDCIDVRRSGT